MLNTKLKRLHENAVIPAKVHSTDSAYDLVATSMIGVDTGEYGYLEYGIGWAMEIQPGYVGLIYPRSSLSKTGLIQANSIGRIDSDYRGQVTVRFKAIPGTKVYEVGDRIAQIAIVPHLESTWEVVDELSSTERGTGGYGSTGA